MTIKELMEELKGYPSDTRLDFVMVDKNWEDAPYDPYIKYFGIVGSSADMDDEDRYLEVAFQVIPESRETLKKLLIEHANLECDICKILIENDGEGSAFTDGSAFSNVGVDDRIACPKCAFYLKQED